MSEPADRRVAAAAKRSTSVRVRLTRTEAAQLQQRARQYDPPTVAAWVRHLIAEDLGGKKPKAD
jgi:hypothetical protein